MTATNKEKKSGQAMVEFALALPVLLLVVYGLIESARLIFIYASTVTAARQAVRYGSATGDNTSGTPFWEDCTGIKNAAKHVGFINRFNDADIQITYDKGLDSSGNPVSFTGGVFLSCGQLSTINNNYRINVKVSTQYSPIVPLVPQFSSFTISSASSRTLLNAVSIAVNSPPQQYVPGGGISLTVQATSESSSAPYYSAVGDIIHFDYIVTNNGTTDITSPGTEINDQLMSNNGITVTCPTADILINQSVTCTADYPITQADLDNGFIYSNAYAATTNPSFTFDTNPPVLTSKQAQILAGLSLTKSVSPTTAGAGDTVTYTYTLQNTGNVTLHNFSVSDDKLGTVGCSSIVSLAPSDGPATCTANYTITDADVTAGAVTNTAYATAKKPDTVGGDTIQSNSDSAVVATRAIYLSVTSDPPTATDKNQNITWTYTIKNTGTVDIKSPSVSDSTVTVTCPDVTVSPGNTVDCTGPYTTTQADVDAGGVTIQATASALSTDGLQTFTSNQFTATLTITQTPQITLTITPSTTLATTAGDTIDYQYSLQNTGNVTLNDFSVTDDKVDSVSSISCPVATLAPGDPPITCNGSYTVTQSDIDILGSIVDHATAHGKTPSGVTTDSAEVSATPVITYDAPRLTLEKSSTPTSATGAGEDITYTYTLRNTGNTPLTLTLTSSDVTDDKVPVSCAAAVSPIPVGGSTTCTSSTPYTTTASDVTAGSVVNHATATAVAQSTGATITSNQATYTLPIDTCKPQHGPFTTSPFQMSIYNSGTISLSIKQIIIYFNAQAGQTITQLTFAGIPIWSGTPQGSPATFDSPFLVDPVTIQAGNNGILTVSFSKKYNPNQTERMYIYFNEAACGTTFLDSANTSQLVP